MSTTLRLTIEEYDRMIEADVFRHDRRIELIRGEIREMNALGPNHENVTELVTRWSYENLLKLSVRIRVQCSIGLGTADTVPEPDVVWVVDRSYSAKRPSAEDVLLLIEVSDSSRAYDLGEKRDLYASASINEYWVVDIVERCLHIFRAPSGGVYRDTSIAQYDEIVRPLAFPQIELRVGTVFEL